MILPKIMLIDDETREMDSYFKELKLAFKNKYEIAFCKNIDEAYEFLQKNHHNMKLVILDVMMPPGELLKDVNTDDGLRTGVSFHKEIRNICPNLKILVFTNFSSEEIKEQIEQDKQSKFLHKVDYLPFELIDEIVDFFDNE